MSRLQIREGRAALRSRLAGWRRGNVRASLQKTRQVPAAVIVAHQVDAGLGRTQSRNLQPSSEKGTEADRGGNILRPHHRLRAKCRIVVDHKALEVESRPRQEPNANLVERHLAAQS